MSNNSNFKPTFLYIKKHSITGLWYFGKTTKSDPVKYPGSGIHWMNHFRKHGKENILTLWFRLFQNEAECTKFAINFSIENDIVNSPHWANMVIEDGLGGGTPGRVCKEDTRRKISIKNTGRRYSNEINATKARHGSDNGMFGVRRKGSSSPHYNKPHSEMTKKIMSEKAKLRQKVSCPHCNKIFDPVNAKRWHFEKCKVISH